jgi:hypothetical protein
MMHKYSNRLLQVEGEEVADQAEQSTTMVHALREEPGSYTRTLENGTEVIYAIHPTDDGFIAEWEHVTGEGPARSHKEVFSSHADALRYLEENFDVPLSS